MADRIPALGHLAPNISRRRSPIPNYEILLRLINERARVELGISRMFTISGDRLALTPEFANAVGYAMTVNVGAIALDVAAAASSNAVSAVTVLADVLRQESADSKNLHQANKLLAAEMHRGMLLQYTSRVEQRRQVPSYQRKNRLAGRLKRALQNPDMVTATASGINYINQDRLDVEARHWRRINFGVEPANTPPPKKFNLFGDRPRRFNYKSEIRGSGNIGFDAQPRPPMFLPPGFWLFIGGRVDKEGRDAGTNFVTNVTRRLSITERGKTVEQKLAERRARRANKTLGTGDAEDANSVLEVGLSTVTRRRDRNFGSNVGPLKRRSGALRGRAGGIRVSQQAFYPTRTGSKIPTRGIVGANFLDGGFRALQDNADRIYLGMAREILSDAGVEAANKKAQKTLRRYRPSFELKQLLNERRSVIDRRWFLERFQAAAEAKARGELDDFEF